MGRQLTLAGRPALEIVDLHGRKEDPRGIYMGREVRDRATGEVRYAESKYANPFSREQWGERAIPMFVAYAWALASNDEFVADLGVQWDLVLREVQAVIDAIGRARAKWGWEAWDLRELAGQVLECWCHRQEWYKPGLCHVDIWVQIGREMGVL